MLARMVASPSKLAAPSARDAFLASLSPEERAELDAVTREIKAGRFRDLPQSADVSLDALLEEVRFAAELDQVG